MNKKLIDGDFEDRTAYETENEIIICGDPDEVKDHNCDEMGCTSISHVVYRFRKTLRQENETLKAENKRLDMCLFSNTEPSQSYTGLEADLKEAEGAVADLMTLNDTLTGEVEKTNKQYKLLLSAVNGDTTWVNAVDRAEKAEVEVARLLGIFDEIRTVIKLNHKEG